MKPKSISMKAGIAGVAICAAVVVTAPRADEWPQFRGLHRDGVSAETGLLATWPAQGPKVLWRQPLGEGYSALSVTGGRIYTMYGEGDAEYAVALDAATGKQLWRSRVGPKWVDRFGNGPRSTPTIDGDLVFVLGAKGDLAALSTADGTVRWARDLKKEYGAKPPQWGVSTSPLVEGRLLMVNVGGEGVSLVAFDKQTGKEVWRTQSGAAGYSAPLSFTVGDVRQVLFFNANGLAAVAPSDGRLLWKQEWKTDWDVNASTPIFVAPDKVFVSSGYGKGAAMLRLVPGETGIAVEEVWSNRELKNRFSSSVLHDGFIYGFDEKIFKCIDVSDGETRWRQRDFGHGSLIVADGRLIVLGDSGRLALVEATAEAYREQGAVQLFQGKTWTMPTLADGKLYLRDEKEIVALEIAERQAPKNKPM